MIFFLPFPNALFFSLAVWDSSDPISVLIQQSGDLRAEGEAALEPVPPSKLTF